MEVTWDSIKAKTNRLKHMVRFPDVVEVFSDPQAIILEDTDSIGEQRFIAVGAGSDSSIYIVVYAYGDQVIGLISARKANRAEQKRYGKGI